MTVFNTFKKEEDTKFSKSNFPVQDIHKVIKSYSGQQLDVSTKEFMENRFGYDFSKVRIHTEARAADFAKLINSHAFTINNNIFFAVNQYKPSSNEGIRLLAHELAHITQQKDDFTFNSIELNSSEDLGEQRASEVARNILNENQVYRKNKNSKLLLQREKTTDSHNTSITKTTINSPTRGSYNIKGKTLSEVANELKKREENDKGAGETKWNLYSSFEFDANGIITKATVIVTIKITMPEWPYVVKLSTAVKEEWNRFYQALEEHEKGHLKLVNEKLIGLAESLIGKSGDEAKKNVTSASEELQKSSDEYDIETEHGKKYGCVINTDTE